MFGTQEHMRKVDPEDYLCLGAHSIRGVQTGVVVWSPGLKSLFMILVIQRVLLIVAAPWLVHSSLD